MGPNKLRTDRLLQGGKTESYVVFEIPEKYKGKEFTYHIVYEPVLSGYGCGVEYIVN